MTHLTYNNDLPNLNGNVDFQFLSVGCNGLAVSQLHFHTHHKLVVIRMVKALSQREAPVHHIPEIKCNGVNL